MKIFFKGGRSGQCFLLQTGAKSTVTDLSEIRSLEFGLSTFGKKFNSIKCCKTVFHSVVKHLFNMVKRIAFGAD